MKNISKFSLLILFVGSIVACESVDNPAAINTIDETRTATIKGIVRANLNTRNDTTEFGGFQIQYESAPAGTKVFVEVDSRDYATSTTGGNYQQLVFETTVDANGEFEIAIPALARSIEADVRADEFVANQVVGDNETERILYRFAEDDVDFTENSTVFVRLFYSETSFK